MVSSLVAAIASTTASLSVGSPARFMTSTATSNSAWTKPIGCVQGRPVALVKPSASSAALSPVERRLEGMARRPPDFRRQIVAGLAERLDRLREQQRLADRARSWA